MVSLPIAKGSPVAHVVFENPLIDFACAQPYRPLTPPTTAPHCETVETRRLSSHFLQLPLPIGLGDEILHELHPTGKLSRNRV